MRAVRGRARAAAGGFVGALAVSALQAALRFALGGVWVAEVVAQQLFALVPMPVFRAAVGALGFAAKWVALAAMVLLYALLGAALAAATVGWLAGFDRTGARRNWRSVAAVGLGFGLLEWAVLSTWLVPSRLLPQLSGPLTEVWPRLAFDTVWGLTWAAIARGWITRAAPLPRSPNGTGPDRAGANSYPVGWGRGRRGTGPARGAEASAETP